MTMETKQKYLQNIWQLWNTQSTDIKLKNINVIAVVGFVAVGPYYIA